MEDLILKVPSMSCSHCENTIKSSLKKCNGIVDVNIDLKTKTVNVQFNPDEISINNIQQTIEDLGYNID